MLLYEGGTLGGFLEQYQAIPVAEHEVELPERIASKVLDALISQPELRTLVVDGLVEALGHAQSYIEAGHTADMLLTLGDELRRSDINAILHHFQTNDQVASAVLANRPLHELVTRYAPDLERQFWPGGYRT